MWGEGIGAAGKFVEILGYGMGQDGVVPLTGRMKTRLNDLKLVTNKEVTQFKCVFRG